MPDDHDDDNAAGTNGGDKALSGRVALVTGGSRGIGRPICVALGRRGATVAVNYATRADALRENEQRVARDLTPSGKA